MKIDHAVKFFGSQTNMAEALGISDSAISRWKQRGKIVPLKKALMIANLSAGEVDLRLGDYK